VFGNVSSQRCDLEGHSSQNAPNLEKVQNWRQLWLSDNAERFSFWAPPQTPVLLGGGLPLDPAGSLTPDIPSQSAPFSKPWIRLCPVTNIRRTIGLADFIMAVNKENNRDYSRKVGWFVMNTSPHWCHPLYSTVLYNNRPSSSLSLAFSGHPCTSAATSITDIRRLIRNRRHGDMAWKYVTQQGRSYI